LTLPRLKHVGFCAHARATHSISVVPYSKWHRSVPHGTLPASGPCVHLSAHTAPRSIALSDLSNVRVTPPPLRLRPQDVSIVHVGLRAVVVSIDGAPVPRLPPFGVGISCAGSHRPSQPGYVCPLPFGWLHALLGTSYPPGALYLPCGWPTGRQGLPCLRRPVPKRVFTLRSYEMRVGWVLPLPRGRGVPV
jgi:hypothetical protein